MRSSVGWTLDRHVENLQLTGSANWRASGNDLANKLNGNNGANQLSGLGGNDRLWGGRGNDRLEGGAGMDVMDGGAGKDTFVFTALSHMGTGRARDQITGFEKRRDIIDLSGIDADTTSRGNQAFELIFNAPFGKDGGELRYSDGILAGDVNGDGTADFEIAYLASGLRSDFVL